MSKASCERAWLLAFVRVHVLAACVHACHMPKHGCEHVVQASTRAVKAYTTFGGPTCRDEGLWWVVRAAEACIINDGAKKSTHTHTRTHTHKHMHTLQARGFDTHRCRLKAQRDLVGRHLHLRLAQQVLRQRAQRVVHLLDQLTSCGRNVHSHSTQRAQRLAAYRDPEVHACLLTPHHPEVLHKTLPHAHPLAPAVAHLTGRCRTAGGPPQC